MLRGAGRNRARPRGAPGGAAAADPAGRPYRTSWDSPPPLPTAPRRHYDRRRTDYRVRQLLIP
jgi:hypothetical protein